MSTASVTAPSPTGGAPSPRHRRTGEVVGWVMHLVVLVLSVLLIVFISYDTFTNHNFLANKAYMHFQFWVCVVFMADFFVEMVFAPRKWVYVRSRLLFLLLSIPYLNLVEYLQIPLSPEELYFVRFIPLARGALALSIVFGYFSNNAVTSFFMSYIVISLMLVYFGSLIFYQCEQTVNPEVDSYWVALWWAFMNMSTVGCSITPMTVAGKITCVILPIAGMIIFPLFTVYLTDYVRRHTRSGIKQ